MEYSWGLAAARAPPPENYQRFQLQQLQEQQQQSPNRAARSNSTASVSESFAGKKRRPRLFGHSRTSSASSIRKESVDANHHNQPPPRDSPLRSSVGDAAADAPGEASSASGGGGGAAAKRPATPARAATSPGAGSPSSPSRSGGGDKEQASPKQQQKRRDRMSTSVDYYQDKQLPAIPGLETPDTAAARSKHNPPATTSGKGGTSNNNTANTTAGKRSSVSTAPSPRLPPSPRAAPTANQPADRRGAAAAAAPHHAEKQAEHHPALPRSSGSGMSAPFSMRIGAMGPDSMYGAAIYSSAMGGSAAAAAAALSSRTTMASSDAAPSEPASADSASSRGVAAVRAKPLLVRNGRTYISEPTLRYPLPVDLAELHRQSLRTLLLFQLFGGPVCSPSLRTGTGTPPTKVLEVGCGSGFWSMMCHRYYKQQGHRGISFTGIDVVPLAPGTSRGSGSVDSSSGGVGGTAGERSSSASLPPSAPPGGGRRPDKDMDWRFVRHDMYKTPWPLEDGEFDLVMIKDMSLATPLVLLQQLMDEWLRILRPGGTLEIWDSDHTIRMLRPHVPAEQHHQRQRRPAAAARATGGEAVDGASPASDSSSPASSSSEDNDDEEGSSSEEELEAAAGLGAYVMTGHTPLSAPHNNFLVEYNSWVSRALEARGLSPVPCTLIGPTLVQEAETLVGVGSRRLAVPLSELRWEGSAADASAAGREDGAARRGSRSAPALTAALRKTALTTVVQQIQSLEVPLREASGKSQDEWDGWLGKMMNDLVRENGTSLGECLEVGAWWAKKRA